MYKQNKSNAEQTDELFISMLSELIEKNKELLARAQGFLKNAPEGRIHCFSKNGRNYYMHVSEATGKRLKRYLRKTEGELASDLAVKRYYEKLNRIIPRNLLLLDEFKDRYDFCPEKTALSRLPKGINELMNSSGLCSSCFGNTYSEAAKMWLNKTSALNPNYTEGRRYKTMCGIYVRSKSEMMIADTLFLAGIAFRYEAPLTISGKTWYPDFTILLPGSTPENLRTVIWEHWGMMDDSEYISDFMYKIKSYAEAGFIEGHNMVCTYETRNMPLTSTMINDAVNMLRHM